MKKHLRTFTGASLAQVAFPLGGIGTGMVSLGGRGNLQDWEIFNRPNKGGKFGHSFFALRAEPKGGEAVAKILEREFLPPFASALGFGHGALAGLPRFREVTFRGEYPFAWLDFTDDKMPVKVSLEAFNPFIPMNVADSSIPGAILRYTIRNPLKVPVSVSLLATMTNPVGVQAHESKNEIKETINAYREGDGLRGIYYSVPGLPKNDLNFGTAALTTDVKAVDCQTHLYRGGGWWDHSHVLWDEFSQTGRVTPRIEFRHGKPLPAKRTKRKNEIGVLCQRARLAPGEARTFNIFIHWHFPNTLLWSGLFTTAKTTAIPVRTYAAKQFADAWDAARYTFRNLPRLDKETRRWHATLFNSTLPSEVLEAVSSQMSIIRSPTVLRLSNGNIYAWEGCADKGGSCHGNCTHVWNYEQALAFLFPSLERTMRQIDFGPNMKANGFMQFRCDAPGAHRGWRFHPCADGQMGNVMQAYRDWQLSGDDTFLRAIWPNVKKALEFAWTEPNGWDPDKDGVMEGRQHNTYDIEFYGPNGMLTTIYLGALRAAEEMARYLGEEKKAEEYRAIYECGRRRVEKELWNGNYFIQKVNVMKGLEVPPHLRSPDAKGRHVIPKYQYGEGCLSDQLLGQWEAHVVGLGHIFDPKQVRQTLKSIFKNNFRDPIGSFPNVQRVFALQDEAGLLLCSWPHGHRPALPFVYCDEVWTGIEYQVAAHLIYEGFVKEGLQIVRAVRNRYNGARRNPWNEFECGWHYARALSSWSLIPALSGVRYSAVDQSLTFDPKLSLPFRCVVAAGSAWGLLAVDRKSAKLEVHYGQLVLREFGPRQKPMHFAVPRRIQAGESVRITL